MNERTKDKIKEAFKETCPMNVPIREQIARCMRGDCDNCLQVTKFIGVLQTRPIIKDEDYIEMAIDEAKEGVRQLAMITACNNCLFRCKCEYIDSKYEKPYLHCEHLKDFINGIYSKEDTAILNKLCDELKEKMRQQAYKSACKLCSDYPHCTILEQDKKAYLTCGQLDQFIAEMEYYGR